MIFAQNLSISFNDNLDKKTNSKILKFEGSFSNEIELFQKTNSIKKILFSDGYLLSEAILKKDGQNAQIQITAGQRILEAQIDIDFPDDFAIPQRKPDFNFKQLSKENLEAAIQNQLSFLENNGYPFSSIFLEDYFFKKDTLFGNLKIETGPFITLDSISIKGFDRFSRNVLKYDLGFREGMAYNEKWLQELPSKMSQVEYLKMTRSPAVAFSKEKNVLFLYLEEQKSNQIDGVIGLNTEPEGKTTVNGEFRLRLLHVFHRGEEIRLQWRHPDESVQSLDFGLQLPYLFKTPFWTQGSLKIFRQDSTFVNTNVSGLLKYKLESGSFLSGGVDYRSSNSLLENESQNALFQSFNSTFFKLGFELLKTNRALVPTRGFQLTAYGLTGERRTSQNSQRQLGWQIDGAQYFPFLKRNVLKIGLQSEAVFGENLFQNELYRIGGLRTLRGFNEQSLFSSAYGIGTLEYRFMIGELDFLAAFADVAYSENKAGENATFNLLTGLGAGLNFQTGGGIFSLFFAVGKDDQNPFDLRATKVHFEYVNRF